jgi:SAM-dependent methyltransferase
MKSQTDRHWGERALRIVDDAEVNIMDVFQRELEYEHIEKHLRPEMRLLEVGCGNGFSTRRFRALVSHVDAFDYSLEMIERARAGVGETNNRFIHDNVLAPEHLAGPYDAVLCIRVLINLQDLGQQRRALANLKQLLRPRGLLLLAEGFREGFQALSALRGEVALAPLEPAKINFYSSLQDLLPELLQEFDLADQFHLGSYDYLTRVLYPLVVGAANAKHNTVFGEQCQKLARAFNPDCFQELSRLRGLILRKRA